MHSFASECKYQKLYLIRNNVLQELVQLPLPQVLPIIWVQLLIIRSSLSKNFYNMLREGKHDAKNRQSVLLLVCSHKIITSS